jgi:branched-chain amino acid transport system substrate-binding protein
LAQNESSSVDGQNPIYKIACPTNLQFHQCEWGFNYFLIHEGRKKTMSKKQFSMDDMDRRTFLKVSGAAGIGVAASTFGVPTLLRAAPPTIKIGSVQPATGPLAVIGVGQRRGNQLAVDYINSMGGIKSMDGAKLELLLGDSESKPEIGRSEADRLIKGGAAVMTGPFQSGVALGHLHPL